METPEVKLKLVLEIDGCEEIIDCIDFTETVADLMASGSLSAENIMDYVQEARPKM
jgi:hypothetical protein